MKQLTPYKDINDIAAIFTRDLKEILGSQLAGFYLTGSLTYGGFDRGSSDIDFWAVLKSPISDPERQRIKAMHASMEKLYPEWADRIEVPYILRDVLGSTMPPEGTRPFFNAGELWEPDPPFHDNWLINLYALRECGVALAGPDPKALIEPIDMKDVREASKRDLRARWQKKLDSGEPFGDGKYWTTSHIRAYSVLTMCRVLYRARNDGVVSKRAASAWVKENYGEWKNLIERAEAWQMGQPMSAEEEAIAFIRFTLDEVG